VSLSLDFQGVWTNPNPHSKVPSGAARRAENLINPKPGVAECVAGMETLAGTYTASDERLSSATTYDGFVIESTAGTTDKLYRIDPSTLTRTAYSGSYSPPSGVERVPMAVADEQLYIATSTGIQLVDGVTDTPGAVGPSPGIEISSASTSATTGGPFSGSTAASGTVTLAGGAGNVTIVTDGTSVGPVAFNATDAQTATDCITALNANAIFAAKATAATGGSGIITITWDTEGTIGNAITLTASRTAGTATASGATLSGGTDPNYAAYRYTIVHYGADGVEQEGTPSGRYVFDGDALVGSGVTTAISSIVSILPESVPSGDRIRLYRTSIDTVTPGDVMYLVHEHELTALERSSRISTISDPTPDALRGQPLYTNASGSGILRQNEQPPFAKAMLAFDDSLLLGNVHGPERFTMRLLAQPDIGDTITIASEVFTAADEFAVHADGEFWADGYSTGTVSQQIAHTATELAHAINMKTSGTLYARYVSGENDPPGMLTIERRSIVGATFTVVASANGDIYEPNITTAQSSLATTEPNGIWVSKRGQHYAFPPLRSAGTGATYRFKVGTKGGAILAMAALRDSVIVFVEKEGVFKVRRTGAESWRSDQINNNAHLLVPGSVAVVDNQVLALTTRGLVAVDESGVEEIDLPIKDKFKAIIELGPDLLLPLCFAVGDEARLRYIFYHPLTSSSTTADHAWVYNADQGTWTERTDAASGGLVSEDDGLLYLGSATSNTLTRERTGTDAQVYKRPDNTAIPVRLEWTVMDEEDPGAEKQFTDLLLLTEDAITGAVTFNCTNDLGGTESTTGSTSDNATGEPFVLAWVPDGCQRTTRLRVDIQRSVLGEAFEVVGFKALVAGTYNGGMQR
jgi:hypothetical protein